MGRISCTSWVISDFVLKIANFRCHGNGGMSEPNVTGIVESADPENHTIELKITTLLYVIHNPSYGKFSGKIPNVSLPWQQGSSEQSSIKLTDPENPLVGATIWRYQLHKLSYSRFCAENRKFSMPWQQGHVRAKCDWHSWVGRPRKPYHRTKNYDSITGWTVVQALC